MDSASRSRAKPGKYSFQSSMAVVVGGQGMFICFLGLADFFYHGFSVVADSVSFRFLGVRIRFVLVRIPKKDSIFHFIIEFFFSLSSYLFLLFLFLFSFVVLDL